MNRKQFLKSLLVVPAIVLFEKNIFAKEKTIEEQISEASKDPNLTIISDNKWEIPNPYKLPFIYSENNQIENINNLCEHIYDIDINDYLGNLIKERFKTIISLVDDNFYYSLYWSIKHQCNKIVIIGHNIDWWTPIGKATEKGQYTIDEDSIKDTSTYLTIKDKEIIKTYLNEKSKVQKLLDLHNKRFISTNTLLKKLKNFNL